MMLLSIKQQRQFSKFYQHIRTVIWLSISFTIPFQVYGDQGSQLIDISSIPNYANVCEKKGRNLDCIGKTPYKQKVTFFDEYESKNFIVKKFGFIPEKIQITKKSNKKTIHLAKMNYLLEPSILKSQKDKKLQREINKKLSNIFSTQMNEIEILNANIYGFIRLEKRDQLKLLVIPLMIDERSLIREIAGINRNRNEKKHFNIVNKILNSQISRLIAQVSTKLNIQGVDGLSFDFHIPLYKPKLDYETISYSYSNFGGIRYLADGTAIQTTIHVSGTRRESKITDVLDTMKYELVILQNSKKSNKQPALINTKDLILTNEYFDYIKSDNNRKKIRIQHK